MQNYKILMIFFGFVRIEFRIFNNSFLVLFSTSSPLGPYQTITFFICLLSNRSGLLFNKERVKVLISRSSDVNKYH